ncbi:hypothetical protein P7K49_016421 [Saguinus oedipus]|uniref:Olduvai domain-containing protein n=1 Tax=Saguinus oedipus TaxID=9490 RepID=A0ABQ9VBZ5_SAGOE|nr:hypothetical protein P7K49_016421 [Saguinus oedipus]
MDQENQLSQELLEAKEQKAPEDPLDEIYWTPSVQGKLSDCQQPYSSASSSLKNQLTCPALDLASSTQATCPQGTWSGDLSHSLSEVQASQTQLDPSTLVPSFLRIELDEVFYCGSGSARQGLSSTTCSFTVNVDPDSPLLHYGFLHTPSGSNSLAQTPAVFPTFSGVQSQNQDPELVLAPSIQIKNPLQMEGSADNTQGDQVPGNIHASTDQKPKIKRKLPFSNPVDNREISPKLSERRLKSLEPQGTTPICEEYKLRIASLKMDILNFTEGILEQELRRIEELRHFPKQEEQLAKLQEERDAMLNQHFKAHLTPDDPDKSQGQNLQEQLAKGLRLAEHYVSKLSPENDKDDEDCTEEEVEKVEKSAAPRLSQELLEAKEQKAPEDSLDEIYWTPSVQGKLSDCQQPYSSASSSLKNQLTCPALDVASKSVVPAVPPGGPTAPAGSPLEKHSGNKWS